MQAPMDLRRGFRFALFLQAQRVRFGHLNRRESQPNPLFDRVQTRKY